jgi:NAD(P)-dependent dehydrogenase (short-subunit alcohol dehydrogenase family)
MPAAMTDTIDPRTYRPAVNLLSDRVVLITGASDGIGKAVAQAAAAHGARVLLHGRNVRKLEGVYDAIVDAKHPRPSIVPLDFEKAGPV